MQKTLKNSANTLFVLATILLLTLIAAFSSVKAQEATTQGMPTDRELRSIASRCVNAQSKVRTLQQQTTEAGNKRAKVFNQIDARLWVAVGKLKMGGKDTTELQKTHTEFVEKTTQYTELNQAYIQSLGELAQSGCKEDPATFKANLEVARAKNQEIRTLNAEIRTMATNDLKDVIGSLSNEGLGTDESAASESQAAEGEE